MSVKVKSLTKNEILKEVVETLKSQAIDHISAKEVDAILTAYEKVLLVEWKTKGIFKFLNVGKFKVSDRKERTGINPLTKESITIPAKKVPKFTFNKSVKEFILDK